MITARQRHRAAMMSNGMYTSRAIGRKWTCENLYNDTHLYTRSVDLPRNLIGDVGKIKVAMTELGSDLYIGFSGTQDAEFWLYNIDTDIGLVPHASMVGANYRVHKGFRDLTQTVFHSLFNKLPEEIDDTFQKYENIIFTGHSAGGAVASLMPLEIIHGWDIKHEQLKVIDFGTPRIWASKIFKYPFERIRFQHVFDLVPCSPLHWRGPFPGFSHTGPAIWTTTDYKVLDKAPWYRIPRIIWEYAKGVVTASAARKALKYHSSHQYSSTVLANYFIEDSP